MNLVIDSGNTTLKAGVFVQAELKSVHRDIPVGKLPVLIKTINPDHIIISSVSALDLSVPENSHSKKIIHLSPASPLPVKLLYETPETLGTDRIAGVAGAKLFYPEDNCLVIDTGTCITFNFISKDSCYFGGSISPGIRMRFKALNTFTARLPLVELENSVSLIGKDTNSSILSGVINGTLAEVTGMIENYRKEFPGLRIIITGGDATFFESKIKESIFVVPDLVLYGLNRILEYNLK